MVDKLTFEEACAGWDLTEPEQGVMGHYWMEGDSLAPPCQTDLGIVEEILQFSEIQRTDVVYDLGCGDGRICILASKLTGCRSVGAEIEPDLIDKFHANIERHMSAPSEQGLVEVFSGDLRELDIMRATVIVLYLLPESIAEITPLLTKVIAANNCKLICNTWGPKSFTPIAEITVGEMRNVTLFKYDKTSLSLPRGV